jgi:lipoprotein-anchoring transpeptidase ErfK/SrfK
VALGAKAVKLEVDTQNNIVRVLAKDGALLAAYPASIGSEEKPAPSGTLKVVRVARNPTYTYDPEFKFHGVKAKEKVHIAAGPNNPVGSVWIALDQKSYGIHGTAEPSKVGKTDSHGCVRMTNWDALALAKIVRKGMPVEFVD